MVKISYENSNFKGYKQPLNDVWLQEIVGNKFN